jgi:hypothetical protein
MVQLTDVTLIALSGLNYQTKENIKALDISSKDIKFGAVKYIQLGEVNDIDSWNRAIIYEFPKYVDTSHALLIHGDGYVVNPSLWRLEWLQYDYVGAPWPLPQDDYSYRDGEGNIVRVGNSVSLRSKKLMDMMTAIPEDYFWSMKEKYGNTNEDGFICCHNRLWLEKGGCKFAPLEVAMNFSKEHEIPENKGLMTFAFHSL